MAWDGLLAFWLAAVLFFSWILVLFWATLRAINREAVGTGSTQPHPETSGVPG
jgi:hypothetical protein